MGKRSKNPMIWVRFSLISPLILTGQICMGFEVAP